MIGRVTARSALTSSDTGVDLTLLTVLHGPIMAGRAPHRFTAITRNRDRRGFRAPADRAHADTLPGPVHCAE